jgi:aminobenzoyl-glutamate utilization protein B
VQNTDEIWRLVDAKKGLFEQLSDQVWDTPELCYTEFRSCAEHTALLERQGFRVTKNVAGIPTAVVGEAGEEGRWSTSSANMTHCPAWARHPASPK